MENWIAFCMGNLVGWFSFLRLVRCSDRHRNCRWLRTRAHHAASYELAKRDWRNSHSRVRRRRMALWMQPVDDSDMAACYNFRFLSSNYLEIFQGPFGVRQLVDEVAQRVCPRALTR